MPGTKKAAAAPAADIVNRNFSNTSMSK
eukprot:SAG31_NODE_35278_length_324_cov_1.382222_1_plen_27_part_10